MYRNLGLHNDRIQDCLLLPIEIVQSEDRHDYFLFLGDLNTHHVECSFAKTSRSLPTALRRRNETDTGVRLEAVSPINLADLLAELQTNC